MCICPLPFGPLSQLPPHPTFEIVTEPWFEFPESYSKVPQAIYLTGGKLLYDVVLVSDIQQHDSAHTLEPPSAPLIPTLGHHRVPDWAPCVTRHSSPAVYFTPQCAYVSATFSIRSTLSLLHCVHKSVLHSFSIPSLQIHSSMPFSRFHIMC